MSIEALKSEVLALPEQERRKLMAFMVALQDEGRSEYANELARRIDDRSAAAWRTPEDCERELGLSNKSK